MNLSESLLRGIYAYGFEKPSAIQQRAILPCIKGKISAPKQARNCPWVELHVFGSAYLISQGQNNTFIYTGLALVCALTGVF